MILNYELKSTLLSEKTDYKWLMVGKALTSIDSPKSIQSHTSIRSPTSIKHIFIDCLPEENVQFILDYAIAIQFEVDYSLWGYNLYVKFPKNSAVEYILKFKDN